MKEQLIRKPFNVEKEFEGEGEKSVRRPIFLDKKSNNDFSITQSSFMGVTPETLPNTNMNKTGNFGNSVVSSMNEEIQDIVTEGKYMQATDSSKQKIHLSMLHKKTRSSNF